ncbi:MAG TPA: tetratricopeptide repeat protein, partial [Desulfobacterales bacterium]|nr:tetratricopeptide repeat protein [Desulfobacterales bacterium]
MPQAVSTTHASALLARNQLQAALDVLEQVLAADPNDHVAHNEKGVALARAGRQEEALAWFAEVVQRFPRYPTAILNYIFLLLQVGKVDQAHTVFRTFAGTLSAEQQQQVAQAIGRGQVPGMEQLSAVPLPLRAFPADFAPQALPPSQPPRPIFFIVGMPKSGTTWLYHLLNAHPSLACAAETDLNLL